MYQTLIDLALNAGFRAGVPIEVVGRAVAASCSNRDKPVRSLRFADREVEKYFKAWKSRQVGSDRTVRTSFVDGFDAFVKRLGEFEFSKVERDKSVLLSRAVERLEDLRLAHEDAFTLQTGLEVTERELCDELWARVDEQLRAVITAAVSNATAASPSNGSAEDDLLFIRMRNKKLREYFGLPVFEIQLSEAW